MRILVGGGTGFVGKHVKSLLTKKGYNVVNISRKSAPGVITWKDLEAGGIPSDIKAVVNLAGENVMNLFTRFTPEFKAKLRDSRIHTTKKLADLIANAETPPHVFVSASAIGYYKASVTAEYTEDSGTGDDFMSTLCQDWETAASLPDTTQCRHVCVRLGLAHGRDGGVVQNMILPFWLGAGGRIGSGNQWYPWIHVDDVAGIIAHAIENEHVTGVLNAVAPESATNNDFTKAFSKALSRPAVLPVPAFAVNCLLGADRGAMLLQGQHVIPKRTLESGYKFQYPDLTSACNEFAHMF